MTLSDSFFFLEFAIPRMGKRADAVIVTGGRSFRDRVQGRRRRLREACD